MVKNQFGSSLVEVMVMMTIMSISIVGIYTMVNAGQHLAQTTEKRRIALDIAREGIESVTNIRDTFALRKYTSNPECFFSIDAENYGTCPDTDENYILLSRPARLAAATVFPVCIDENGWYTQGRITDTENCTPSTKRCEQTNEKNCKTLYERTITMSTCDDLPETDCLQSNVAVAW